MSDNFVSITGNMTRDPELRYTTGGFAVCSFSLAHNTRVKNANGEWEDGDPSFFNCTAWRELGEHVAESLGKGQRVTVVGKLKQRTWEDDDGNKRSAVDIICDDVSGSLRWGTTRFQRAERSDSTPVAQPAHRGPEPQEPVHSDDEEPF